MNWFDNLPGMLDALMIFFFRVPHNPVLGLFLGTAVLGVVCSIAGLYMGLTFSLLNRSYSRNLKQETVSLHNLSMKAIAAGDKTAYSGCNRLANEAFGRYFFAQFGGGAATLLPIPFALGWMQTRFDGVALALPFHVPGLGDAVGVPVIFFLMYILIRILLKHAVSRLPLINRIQKTLRLSETSEKMIGFSEAMDDTEDLSQPVSSFIEATRPVKTT